MKTTKERLLILLERWADFLSILFDPINLALLALSIALYLYSINQADSRTLAVLTLVLSLLTGLLGGIYAKRWEDITEEKVIVTRAKSANRSLQLLLGSAISLERRVRLYLQRHNDKNYKGKLNHEVLKTYLEEIVEECISLEQEVINSIEDWTDILPNAEVKTVLGLIGELNMRSTEAAAELELVNSALQETKDKSAEEVNKLENEKKTLEKELTNIRQELRDKSLQVGIPTISGSLITGGTIHSSQPAFLRGGVNYEGVQGIGRTFRSSFDRIAIGDQDREKGQEEVSKK